LFSDKIHLNSIPSLLGVPYRKVKKFWLLGRIRNRNALSVNSYHLLLFARSDSLWSYILVNSGFARKGVMIYWFVWFRRGDTGGIFMSFVSIIWKRKIRKSRGIIVCWRKKCQRWLLNFWLGRLHRW
jgi:hypothetical protein